MSIFDSLKNKVKKIFELSKNEEKENKISNKTEFKEEKAVAETASSKNNKKVLLKQQKEEEILNLSKKSFSELTELYNQFYHSSNNDLNLIHNKLTNILAASLVKRGIKLAEANNLLEDNEYLNFNPFKFRCDDPIFEFLEYFNNYNKTISPIINNSGCYYLLLKLFSENKLERHQLTFKCKSLEAPWILLNKNFWNDEEYYKDDMFGWIVQWWLWSGDIKNNLDQMDNKVLLLVLFGDTFFEKNKFLFEQPTLVNPSQKHEIIKDLVENILTTENIINSDDKEYEYIINQIRRYNFYTKWGEFYDELEPIINFIYIYYNYEKYSYLDYSISEDNIENLINDKLIALKNKRLDFINDLVEKDEKGFHLNKSKLQSTSIIAYNNNRMVGDNVRRY